MDALIKPNDMAARLGVSRTWLYAAARDGRIPSIRMGGDEGPLRFVAEDIDRWIDEARGNWQGARSASGTRQLSRLKRTARPARRARSRASSGQQKLI